MNDDEKKRKEVVDKISKHIHPHDDEPDPTLIWGTTTFLRFIRALGFVTMFVLSVNEIDKFKGCPFPRYFDEPIPKTPD